MCDKKLLEKVISEIAVFSKNLFKDKLKSVILYGSYARGDYDDESDIDIMIVVDMTQEELCKYRWDLSCCCSNVNIENGVFTAAVLVSEAMLEKWKYDMPFYANVIKEGIVYA